MMSRYKTGKSFTQHEFEVESERIQGLIRGQKVRGLEFDLDAERYRSDAKSIGAKIERTKVNIADMKYLTEQQKLFQARNVLSTESVRTLISGVHLETERNNLKGEQATHAIAEAEWRVKLEALDLGLNEAKKALFNRKTLLQLQGKIDR